MKGVSILGSTGSIGLSTLDVLARHPDRYRIVALSACTSIELLADQCVTFAPDYAVVADTDQVDAFRQLLAQKGATDVQVLTGQEGLETIASLDEVDDVMAAIVGAAGLMPTLAAARAGKTVLLANKESLVMSGQLLMDAVHENGASLLPIDSEHNAIFQCLPEQHPVDGPELRRIILTGSGGPFRETALAELEKMTPEQACDHPNWDMGRKISVDSATMMNKGLELIEACRLFETTPERVHVVLHPQSIVHSMVEYVDGSVVAQLGNPDMRTPIAHALAFPERIESGVGSLDLINGPPLTFEQPDLERFPCLAHAMRAAAEGGLMPTILNAANEIAVAAFLDEQLPFTGIAEVVGHCLDTCAPRAGDSLEHVLEADALARDVASSFINGPSREVAT